MDHFLNFESLILKELHREFHEILRQRNIQLKPARIELFDSLSCWGKYDPLVQVIYLSRQLINRFSWAHVIGVLKHEVAHLWVHTYFPNTHLPHGPEFKKACEILKIPSMYRSAQVDLSDHNPDFRIEPDLKNPLVEKIKKLMALATSSNPHEAKLAAAKVHELYVKYNTEAISTNQQPNQESEFIHHIIQTSQKRLSIYQKKIISILIEHFFVQIVIVPLFDPKKCQHDQALEVMGYKENVLMAEYVFYFLLQKINEVDDKSSLKRNSLKMGLIDGFKLKFNKPITDQKKLLVLADQKLTEYTRAYFPRLRQLSSSSRKISIEDYNKGLDQGQKINLNRPITEKKVTGVKRITC